VILIGSTSAVLYIGLLSSCRFEFAQDGDCLLCFSEVHIARDGISGRPGLCGPVGHIDCDRPVRSWETRGCAATAKAIISTAVGTRVPERLRPNVSLGSRAVLWRSAVSVGSAFSTGHRRTALT
jgi:hypothetical protein